MIMTSEDSQLVSPNSRRLYRVAFGLCIITSLLMLVVAGGVGILGRDGDPANAMYLAIIALLVCGSVFTRRQALGMAITMIATLPVFMVIVAAAFAMGMQYAPHNSVTEIVLLNLFFASLYLVCACLFYLSFINPQHPAQ